MSHGSRVLRKGSKQESEYPTSNRDDPDDHEEPTEKNEGTQVPVHLTAYWIGIVPRFRAKLDNELRPGRLLEVQVLTLALDDVSHALQQVHQLVRVYGHRGLGEGVAIAVFDLHGGILPHMPADLRLLEDDQKALVGLVREFCLGEVAGSVDEYEKRGQDPADFYSKLAELGLGGLPFPEEYGGGGQTYSSYLLAIEELAYHHLSLAIGVSVHTLCAFAVNEFGTDAQRKEILAKLAAGEWYGAYSLSESGSGSDAAALSTKAVRADGSYLLNGGKLWCTRGNEADVVLMMARTGAAGPKGISAFLVTKGTDGFVGAKKEDKMGWRASPTWQLTLDDVVVPESHRLGEEGIGFRIAMASLDSGRLGIAACGIGLAQAAMDAALSFTSEREQFGKPVNQNQGLQFMLADMSTQIEAGRRLYRHAAALRDAGEDYGMQAAQAKLFCTDTAMRVAIDAVQLHGGYGYVTEYPAERFMRDAKGLQIVEGTNQIQRHVIGRRLTKP